jgi:hypothetical protein
MLSGPSTDVSDQTREHVCFSSQTNSRCTIRGEAALSQIIRRISGGREENRGNDVVAIGRASGDESVDMSSRMKAN